VLEQAVPRGTLQRRTGHTTSVTIAGERFHLTANAGDDGRLSEVFLRWGKQGSTRAGLMDIYALAISVGLQHGIPLVDLVHQGLDLWFAPQGRTDDPQIPRVRSVADWVAHRLAIDWLPEAERAAEGILTVQEREERAHGWMAVEDAKFTATVAPDDEFAAFLEEISFGLGTPPRT
jgi:ribonucleoside-diphosphate reductase alpha chain